MRITYLIATTFLFFMPFTVTAEGQQNHWDQYILSDIDKVVEQDSLEDEGGLKIWPGPRKLKLNVILDAFPEVCDTQFLARSLGMVGMSLEALPPITTCIKFKSEKGHVFNAFIQDRVGEFLPKEVKLGQKISIYAAYIYFNDITKNPGLAVNEFEVVQ